MTIVMGLDQHRAQITAEWIDTETGEVSRRGSRRPHREPRAAVPGPLPRPASSRWRWRRRPAGGSWSRSCSRSARGVHLAEPAETAAGAGAEEARQDRPRRRPASARAVDGRAAAGVVDPARAPPRSARPGAAAHTLVDQRGEWQQRIQAVLYHHGVPAARWLLTREGARLAGEPQRCRARARAGHGRAGDDRRARRAARAARPRAARLRAPPAGLPGADGATTGSAR